MMSTLRQFAAVIAMLCLAQAALAQPMPRPDGASFAIADPLRQTLVSTSSREQFIQRLAEEIRNYARDRQGIDLQDIELTDTIGLAAMRAQYAARNLTYDLDGDGKVTPAEIETVVKKLMRNLPDERLAPVVAQVMAADRNKDGVIDLEEMRKPELPALPNPVSARMRSLLALDPNKDGRLTIPEIESLARDAWTRADKDGDGTLSPDERIAVAGGPAAPRAGEPPRVAPARPAPAPARASCDLPTPDVRDKIVAFGAYEGHAIPTVTVVGPDAESFAARVIVEPGDSPLYVVLASHHSVIWQFEGAVGRVSRVVLSSSQKNPDGGSGAALTGVPRDKVRFAPSTCLRYFSVADSIEGGRARASITTLLGRTPDTLFASYKATILRLTEGKVDAAARNGANAPLPAGFDRVTWSRHINAPAGIVGIDPAHVVADGKVERYDVMPQAAGLAQLVGAGDLRVLASGRDYKIVRPIARFPAGLSGAHSVRFLLASGVPLPAGSPGHSCVVAEDPGALQGKSDLCH